MRKIMLIIPITTLLVVVLAACGVEPSSTATTTLESESTPSQTEALVTAPTQSNREGFTLSSPDVVEGGALPVEYTCDGNSAALPHTWSGASSNTESFTVVMHHIPEPDDAHWYWVLYDIPADVTSLPQNSSGVGTMGTNSVNGETAYAPPCSKGPGEKAYTYTVYALSAQPQFSVSASEVSRNVLLEAIQDITLASAELNVTYTRTGTEENQQTPEQGAAPEDDGNGRIPPSEAIATCSGENETDACEFTSPKGTESGLCEMVQEQLACSPQRNQGDQPPDNKQPPQDGEPVSDGQIGYNIEQAISDRAQGMGEILHFLSAEQQATPGSMVGKGMLEWPDVEEPAAIRELDHDVKVAVMTYAADMFSWYAGSVEADTYFCPERHGAYFGSFYLKDIHAMSDSSYAIPTDLTGNMGGAMLQTLETDQAALITSLADIQKPSLQGIVDVRE